MFNWLALCVQAEQAKKQREADRKAKLAEGLKKAQDVKEDVEDVVELSPIEKWLETAPTVTTDRTASQGLLSRARTPSTWPQPTGNVQRALFDDSPPMTGFLTSPPFPPEGGVDQCGRGGGQGTQRAHHSRLRRGGTLPARGHSPT